MLRGRSRYLIAAVAISAPIFGYLYQQSEMALAAVRAANAAAGKFPGRRAVVVGGTSGIGHGVALRLAQADFDVTIVGRNEAAGQEIVKQLNSAGKGRSEFVKVDGLNLSNAYDFGDAYLARNPSLDVLVITQGIATMQGRTETVEGLDVKLALHYYGRIAFIDALLPALRKAPSPRVLSVLSGGVHSVYSHWKDDPELKSHYSLKNAADAAGFYNDLSAEALSREADNKDILFVHAAPGAVATNWGSDFPWYLKGPIRFIKTYLSFLLTSLEDCGEFMSAPLLQPRQPGEPGWRIMGRHSQPASPTSAQEEARDFVWAHTRQVLEGVKQNRRMKGQQQEATADLK